jgi:hypothetical protein
MPRFASPLLSAILALTLSSAVAAQEVKYDFILAGNVAGAAVSKTETDGTRVYDFEFNDRGRGSKTTSRIRLDERGYPAAVDVTGHDYWKSPLEERFRREGTKATWSNSSEKGSAEVKGPAFYLSLNGAPQETELMAKALLASPDGRISLLPAGEARIEKITSAQAKAGERTRDVSLYAVSGLGFTPAYVWLDNDRNLFAGLWGWSVVILEGWNDAVPALTKVQEEIAGKRHKDLAATLAHKPKGGGLAFRNARLFDAETGKVRPGTTVVISGNRIQAVGPDAEVKVPEGIEIVDAKGRTLVPGLWDMHTHLGDDDGMFHLQAGVTTVRDLANDIDKLQELRREWDSGEKAGPRVLMAGFIDGPGPYAGPTKVLVDTEEEALQAVDRYAELGYAQVKLYSSLDTRLVAPIIKRAHEKGMRVSGHIPNGMSAEQAVRAGFDEIQHANFLVLNFLDPKIDTRTPARFSEVGEHAAELDLGSQRVKSFIALLKERGTVSDPTLVAFEGMLTGKAGEIDPTLAAVADRFPPQARRGLYSGGLNPPGEKAQRYRDSYRRMAELVGALHKAGVTIVAGTDALAGFSLHRELELYAQAGIPAPDILRLATLGSARVMKKDKELGSIAPGKLADLFLVEGDPAARISDVRRVVLTVKDGVMFDPAEIARALGMSPR